MNFSTRLEGLLQEYGLTQRQAATDISGERDSQARRC